MLNKFSEIEYKMKADNIKLTDFQKLMKSLGKSEVITVSSWDQYYSNSENEYEFIRHRQSDTNPELTIKRKTNSNNNFNRIEIDVPIKPNCEENVQKFVEMLGYKFNFKIYKSCFIHKFKDVNYCYYLTYDENMQFLDAYLETEVNKECIDSIIKRGIDPTEVLNEAAKHLESIGLTSKNRMKKSLYEIYKK